MPAHTQNGRHLVVTLWNAAGDVLDCDTARSPEWAARIAIELIQNSGNLYAGDKLVVTELHEPELPEPSRASHSSS